MRDEQTSVSRYVLLSRRRLLRVALGGAASVAGGAILAACGAVPVPTATPPPTVPAPTPTLGVAATPTRAAPTAPTVATTAPTTARTIAPPAPSPTAAPARAATVAPTAAPAATGATTPATMGGKLPSPAPNVPDAYITPPAPFKSVAVIPGKGSRISITKASQQPPPVPRGENAWWQELERRTGATLDFTLVPLPQFTEKATALIAAGDVPDILLISPLSSPDQYRAVQQGVFTDLTPFLTGAALSEFPNLAQYPASAWRNSMIRGKLYGVPRLGVTFGNALLYRQDWAEKVGPAQPRNADEMLALLVALSKGDPDGNGRPDTYGLGAQGGDWSLGFVQGMFRVPNQWRRNPDGTLTAAIETEEYRQALAFGRKLFEAGVYHPDAATMNRTQATDALVGGKIGAYADALTQLNGDIRVRFEAKRVTPTANVGALVPPGFDGGTGVTYNGTGYGSIAAFPARVGRDPERVREQLRVLDYFSAPFGSEEYTFLTFGLENTHHELRPDGTRVLTQRGRAEINELGTVVLPPRAFYFPSDPGDAAYLQNKAAEIAAIGVDNPALAAFSPTAAMKSAELNRLGTDRVGAIITGREPLSALDGYIRDWRDRGGDVIRRELQDALR